MRTKLMVFLFFAMGLTLAQENDQKQLNDNLNELLKYCKAENYEKAASLIAYQGENTSRNLNDVYKPNNPGELSKVKRIVKKISAFLNLSDSYEVLNFKKEERSGRQWYLLPVVFKSGGQKLKTKFWFVKINDKFVLGDFN